MPAFRNDKLTVTLSPGSTEPFDGPHDSLSTEAPAASTMGAAVRQTSSMVVPPSVMVWLVAVAAFG